MVEEVQKTNDPRDITDKVVKSDLEVLRELKKTKWEEFCKKHATRIAMYPKHGNRKAIPAVWSDVVGDWVWISRRHRRHLERKSKR